MSAQVFLEVLRARADRAAVEWLERVLPRAGGAFERVGFFAAYAGAGRRFPVGASVSDDATARLRAVGVVEPGVFSVSDLARGALLLAAVAVVPEAEHVGLAREAFQRGDNAERVALLRVLPLMPAPERFVDVAVDACRTHVQVVFEAIACENPYPSRHFPEANFNQLVLKALFLDIALARVVGWGDRNNPELKRMVADYAAERRAAGRSVPGGVAMIARGPGTQATT